MATEAASRAPAGEAGFRLLTEHLTDLALLAFDPDLRILGRPAGLSLTAADIPELIYPPDLERVLDRMRHIRTDPAPFAFEHRVVRDDGAVRTVLARGEGVLDEDGRPVRFIGTDQDITDRRRAEAERHRLLGRVYAIKCTEAGVLLRVSDDGVGFRVTTAPGQGTVVEARLPLTDPAEWRWGT